MRSSVTKAAKKEILERLDAEVVVVVQSVEIKAEDRRIEVDDDDGDKGSHR